MLSYTFKLTPKEYLISYLQYIFARKIFRFLIPFYFLTFITIYIIDGLYTPHQLPFIELLLTALITLYYFLLLIIFFVFCIFLGILIRMLIDRRVFNKEVKYLFKEDKVQIKGVSQEIHCTYKGKFKVNKYTYIIKAKAQKDILIIIPKRVFKNTTEENKFLDLIKKSYITTSSKPENN